MTDPRRADAELFMVDTDVKPEDVASQLDEIVKELKSGEEVKYVYPFLDHLERLSPRALLTVTSYRILIHTGTIRTKVIEILPGNAEIRSEEGNWLLAHRMFIHLPNGGKREISFKTAQELDDAMVEIEVLWAMGQSNLERYYAEYTDEAKAWLSFQ